ncbi:MAG TPA: hypothetical protein DEA55_07595 [Rhodospirillaceae bacterium]|nr:hypothetical protein [Rhodospirillaceae bacterium]
MPKEPLLNIVAEEAVETAKDAGRALIQGLQDGVEVLTDAGKVVASDVLRHGASQMNQLADDIDPRTKKKKPTVIQTVRETNTTDGRIIFTSTQTISNKQTPTLGERFGESVEIATDLFRDFFESTGSSKKTKPKSTKPRENVRITPAETQLVPTTTRSAISKWHLVGIPVATGTLTVLGFAGADYFNTLLSSTAELNNKQERSAHTANLKQTTTQPPSIVQKPEHTSASEIVSGQNNGDRYANFTRVEGEGRPITEGTVRVEELPGTTATASLAAIPQPRLKKQHQDKLDRLERNPAYRALKADFEFAESKSGVPWDLLALIAAHETPNFNTESVNDSSHACGVLQVKPDSFMGALYEKLGNPEGLVTRVDVWKDSQGRVVSNQTKFDKGKATKYFVYEAADRKKGKEKILDLCATPKWNLWAGAENLKINANANDKSVFWTVLNVFHRIPTYADGYLTHVFGKDAVRFLELTKDPAQRNKPLSKFFPDKAPGNPFLFKDPKRNGKERTVMEAYEFIVQDVASNEQLPRHMWEHLQDRSPTLAPSRDS